MEKITESDIVKNDTKEYYMLKSVLQNTLHDVESKKAMDLSYVESKAVKNLFDVESKAAKDLFNAKFEAEKEISSLILKSTISITNLENEMANKNNEILKLRGKLDVKGMIEDIEYRIAFKDKMNLN